MRSTTILIAAALATTAQAFSPVATTTRSSTSLQATTRKEFLGAAAAALVASSTGIALPAFAADTVDIQVKKKGDGPIPESGELVAIRFAAEAAGIKLDDIFDSPEPYYTRVGAGGLLQGVEQVLPKMRVGDRWVLTIPGNLAFGPKGRPASAGKPRIPSDATVIFDVEMVGLPGKEPELIDIID